MAINILKKAFWLVSFLIIASFYMIVNHISWILIPLLIIYLLPTIISIIKKDYALPVVILFNIATGWMIFPWFFIMYYSIFGYD